MSEQSITFWIDKLKAGDPEAAQPLWNRYFENLVRLAYQRLRSTSRAVADEEDVALSAFKSFCAAAKQGRFPVLNDRDDLWRLLAVITERKSLNLIRDQGRLKRGGKVDFKQSHEDQSILAEIPGGEPTPAFAAQMAEQCQRLFDQLEDAVLQTIAREKMEGYSNEEIAARNTFALRTVERKLALIRRIWEQNLRENDGQSQTATP